MGFEIGHRAGGYEILEVLHTSGTGVSYKVRNLLADRFEVLKLLPKDLQEDKERVERFLREAKVHSRLNHSNIEIFYSAMEIEGQFVMATEYIDGITLEQRLSHGRLPVAQAVDFAAQALAGLHYAHDAQIVHREVIPRNLLITDKGTVKITGFNLAKVAADPQITQPGMVMGSVYYMAPEQVKGVARIDGRADIYSLGVILYEALTGSKPFDSKSHFEVFQAHVNQAPQPPIQLRDDLPGELNHAILRALEKDPGQRFYTADEFREVLLNIDIEIPEPALAPEVAEPNEAESAEYSSPDWEAEGESLDDPDWEAKLVRPTAAAANGDPEIKFVEPIGAKQTLVSPQAGLDGWRMSELLAIGAITFLMVAVLLMAILIMLNR